MVEICLSENPDLLALAAANPGFFPALFESQSHNEKIGRYDILMGAPATELVAFNQSQLNTLLAAIDCQPKENSHTTPFQWGWLLYFSYESAYAMEAKLAQFQKASNQPLATAIYCQGCIIRDHYAGTTTLWADSQATADGMLNAIEQATPFVARPINLNDLSEADGKAFEAAVTAVKKLILTGDVYQANLSRQYHTRVPEKTSAAMLYERLRRSNPAPFAGLLQLADFAVISSSPERLFKIKNQQIETRPIAGTRPRGETKAADAALVEELLNTPKERAEHIMLIDLGRNDIGKVCQTGSVEVDELMVVESYQHVHHIVSNITGIMRSDMGFVDALKALFPGGTITGCPKIRCMEIIHAIEARPRGAYTGSMGYINHDGQCDLNILIRTVCLHDQQVTFNAGAGIVHDSIPSAELTETKHKAEGMIRALTSDGVAPC